MGLKLYENEPSFKKAMNYCATILKKYDIPLIEIISGKAKQSIDQTQYTQPCLFALVRGSAPDGPGYWMAPTVLAPPDRSGRAYREEIFGTVVSVVRFHDEDEAIQIANEGHFGLSGSIWTRDVGRALRVARGVETGALSVNSNSSVRYSTPFGGFKRSGLGRELGPDALLGFSEEKNVFISTEE